MDLSTTASTSSRFPFRLVRC